MRKSHVSRGGFRGGVRGPGHPYQAAALDATGGGALHISFARKYYGATILRPPPMPLIIYGQRVYAY